MKKLLFILILLLPVFAHATSYTCAGTGNRQWHVTTDWTPNGTPGAGDTVSSIQSGCVMQCEAGQTCTIGLSGAGAGTNDFVVASGGKFVILAGATFDMRGTMTTPGEVDIFGGTLLLDSGIVSSGAYVWDTEGGSSPVIKLCAESTCLTNTGTMGVINCNTASSSTCQINHGSAFSGQIPAWTMCHGAVTNFGSGTLAAIKFSDGQTPATIGWHVGCGTNPSYSLFDHNGAVLVEWNSAARDLTMNVVSMTRPQDVSAASNANTIIEFDNSSTSPTGDRTFHVTASNYPASAEYRIHLNAPGFTGGTSTNPTFIGYNAYLSFGLRPISSLLYALSVIDRAPAPGTTSTQSISPGKLDTLTFSDWVMMNHTANQHHIVGNSGSGGASANSYTRMIFDGDGYRASDAGDDYQDLGPQTTSNGLHINVSGTLFTFSTASLTTFTMAHETAYNTFGGTICELACFAGGFLKLANSLFVLPSLLNTSGLNNNDGMHTSTSYVAADRQTATSSNTDYNYFWQMPGSGDPGANAAKTSLIQLNLGSTISWPAVPSPASNIVTAQNPTVSGTSITGCTGCFTNAQAKDYVVDTTQSPAQYAVIQTVNSTSSVTLYAAIPGYTTNDLLDVRPGYFSTAGLYGTDWGSHDQHAYPDFQDPTRTTCTWWKLQTGSTANCNWTGGSDFVSTSGSGNTTLNDTNVNFSTLGVTDNVDVVAVYSSSFNAFRGSATVTSHTSTALTVGAGLSGVTSGDHFTFITAAQNLGQSVVQLYGFDISGNAVSPPSWVNTSIVSNIESYLFGGFSPTAPALFHAGGDGLTIGCCEVIPRNGGISIAD